MTPQTQKTVKATIIWEETRRMRAVDVEIPAAVYDGPTEDLEAWLITSLDDGDFSGQSIGYQGEGIDYRVELEDAGPDL